MSAVLVVLGACGVFVVGFAVGTWVFSRVLASREHQLSRERKAVNGVWRRVYDETGVPRRVWMSDFRDLGEFVAVESFVSDDGHNYD